MEPRATIDFETRSACDLKKHGSWRYSLDPSTQILCLTYHVPGMPDDDAGLWHPDFPHLGIPEANPDDYLIALCDWIELNGLVEAHNAWFERGIWTNLLHPRYGFPHIQHRQWRCSAAKAAALALPRALGDAVAALKLATQKDMEGHVLMKKISKPRKALKVERDEWANDHGSGKCTQCKGKGTYKRKPCPKCGGLGSFGESDAPALPTLWHEQDEQLVDLFDYCKTDTLAEKGLSDAIPDLNPEETEMYLLDQKINERGFQLDVEAVDAALAIIADETEELNGRLAEVTDGAVLKATQRDRMKKWFATQGLELADTQGATIDFELERATDPIIKEALSIVRELGRSSTGKYQAMARWRCPDGRVRGGLLYHGATTGRWSGAGVQPHNFVRGTIKDQNELWRFIKSRDRASIRAQYGSVMLALANALRGAICAPEGRQLYVADYASIEARVLLWLADDEKHLDLFRRGADLYCDMAESIYQRPINKKDHPEERQLGKVAILGLGYQMGWRKFVESAWTMGGVKIDDDLARITVDAYREKYWRVADLWQAQERAAMNAVVSWRRERCGKVTWFRDDRFLYAELPSKRRLSYPFPDLQMRETSWGEPKLTLTFEGVNPYNRQWQRQTTYGGMIVENLVQAIARDIMADAMLRCEATGTYQPVLSVHDELVAEAEEGQGNVKDFEALLTACPAWAAGCPISAEGYQTVRYRK